MTELPFPDGTFDLVVDRGAITCVDAAASRRMVQEIHRVSKAGARFLFNPYSDRDSSAVGGSKDGFRAKIDVGLLTGVGGLRFYHRSDVEGALASGWRLLSIEHRERTIETSDRDVISAMWFVVAERV